MKFTKQGVRNLDFIGPKPQRKRDRENCEHDYEFSHSHGSCAYSICKKCGDETREGLFEDDRPWNDYFAMSRRDYNRSR